MKAVQRRSMFLVAILTVAWMAGQVDAAVVDLRAEARANPSLMHHYTFEGPHQGPSGTVTTLSRDDYLLDRKGGLHLETWIYTSGPVSYGPGVDALSRAAIGIKNETNHVYGAAWRTTGDTTLPETLTVECVLRPNRKPENFSGYIVGTRNSIDRDRRGYFLLIDSSGKFSLQIGTPNAVAFSDELETNHWYYVVTTFDVTASGATTQTVINAYFADLTADTPLTHALVNHTISGFNARYSFNPSQIGIGCLWNADSRQYPSPASIDEVAIYGSVFSAETIDKHLEALRREMPEVWYREIFPSDNKLEHPSTEEGWFCHWDSTATTVPSKIVVPKADTAFLEDVSPVGSSPSGSGSSFGYLNNHSGPTATNYIYWTEEMTNKVEFAWLRAVEFDTRFAEARNVHVAVRLDENGTADTSDDVWYITRDFTNAVGTSSLSIPGDSNRWWRHMLDTQAAEWTVLDFKPDVILEPGTTQAVPPERARITAFGLFHPIHFHTKNERIDNYTLYVRKIYPPLGTLISVR